MRHVALASLLFCAALLPACIGSEPQVSTRRQAIVNGIDHSGHPAVGNFTFQQPTQPNRSTCTATLVGPLTAITAAHCVVLTASERRLELDSGDIAITDVLAHPSYDPQMPWLADLGLLYLASAPAGVTPLRLSTSAPVRDETVILVGFGKTADNADDDGQKRITQNKVAQVNVEHIAVAPATTQLGAPCHGDSGGPVMRPDPQQRGVDDDVLIATVSYATGNCGSRSLHPRIDFYRSWLEGSGRELRWYDDEPPTVSIGAPAEGTTLDAPRDVAVTISASDNIAVRDVALSLDGKLLAKLDTAPFQHTLARDDVSALSQGAHTLTATARDDEGNSASASVTVTRQLPSADAGVDTQPADAATPHSDGPAVANGGCALLDGHAGAPPTTTLLLLLVFVLLLRRRRC